MHVVSLAATSCNYDSVSSNMHGMRSALVPCLGPTCTHGRLNNSWLNSIKKGLIVGYSMCHNTPLHPEIMPEARSAPRILSGDAGRRAGRGAVRGRRNVGVGGWRHGGGVQNFRKVFLIAAPRRLCRMLHLGTDRPRRQHPVSVLRLHRCRLCFDRRWLCLHRRCLNSHTPVVRAFS